MELFCRRDHVQGGDPPDELLAPWREGDRLFLRRHLVHQRVTRGSHEVTLIVLHHVLLLMHFCILLLLVLLTLLLLQS